VDWAALAVARPKFLEHAVHLQQHPPVPTGVVGVVGGVDLVLAERDRVRHLVWQFMEAYVYVQFRKQSHQALVEIRNRHRGQRQAPGLAIAHRHQQPVIDEIEVDLELTLAVRNRGGG
jgi:hypothetical protein